jgi:predicted dehydrogenase
MLPLIDVLYVATPHAQHYEPAITALQHGTAVLAEKALTVRYHHAEQLVEASRAHKVFLMEAVWMRFNPLHTRLRELVHEGVLGEVRRIVADFSFQLAYDPNHRLYDPLQGGGALLDMGTYPVSLVQSLLGDPAAVDVHGSLTANGVDDCATLLLRYSDGVAAIATCTLRLDGPRTAAILGTSGARVDIDDNMVCPTKMTLRRPGSEPEEFRLDPLLPGYLPELCEVHACLRAGEIESAVMPHNDTLSTMRVLTDALDELGVRYPTGPRDL